MAGNLAPNSEPDRTAGTFGWDLNRLVPDPPGGRAGWTLTRMGERRVEMGVVDRIATETVRGTLKNSLKPWRSHQWCIPPRKNADFVAAMEDVLDVYHRDFDDDTVLVCVDEVSKQLTMEVRTAVPMEPGQPARVDCEYERNGTANRFMVCAPLLGWRHVKVTERRISKVRVFPNLDTLKRLSTAALVEIDEKWETETKAYIKWEQLDE